MLFNFKKLIFALTLNLTFFLILMIGIQNSKEKNKVNLLLGETITLPVSFIIGISFICGSITANILKFDEIKK